MTKRQRSAEEWWAKNECQRNDYVQRIYALSIEDFCAGNSHQASLYSSKTPLLTSVQLSLPHDCIAGSLDLHIAEFMWKKAGRIISQPNSYLPSTIKGRIQTFSVFPKREMSHTVCRFIKTLKRHVHAGILSLNTFALTLLP